MLFRSFFMKKKIAMLMCVALMTTMVGCGSQGNAVNEPEVEASEVVTNEAVATVEVADSVELLANVWSTYDEADKFPIGGGDYENMVTDSVGAFDVTKTEDLDSLLGMPADGAAMIDDAASMMHMMNANTFTSGAYHLTDAANKQAFADLLKDNIMNRQWMCGFPDTLLIVSVGDEYMVSAFGEAQIMENFKTKLLAQYEAAEVLYEESLAE